MAWHPTSNSLQFTIDNWLFAVYRFLHRALNVLNSYYYHWLFLLRFWSTSQQFSFGWAWALRLFCECICWMSLICDRLIFNAIKLMHVLPQFCILIEIPPRNKENARARLRDDRISNHQWTINNSNNKSKIWIYNM